MDRRLLVLGGTAFVGRAVVEAALARGDRVTTFTRGETPAVDDPRIERLHGDRGDPATLTPLADRDWDVVLDTWAGAPLAVDHTARLLAPRAARYVYVSSGSVYDPPNAVGADESWPTADADPADPDSSDYARAKRGAELAAVRAFADRALLARAGLILGPHEDVGRLPWWLGRLARGGEVLAPGLPERPLAYIDARDLAGFLLDAADAGLGGPCNVVSPRGHATMGTLLEACRTTAGAANARLVWTDPAVIQRCGIEGWSELPIWLPPGTPYEGMHGMGVARALAAGLRCRPVAETVADTWAWMGDLDGPPAVRDDLPAPGLAPEREVVALAAAATYQP